MASFIYKPILPIKYKFHDIYLIYFYTKKYITSWKSKINTENPFVILNAGLANEIFNHVQIKVKKLKTSRKFYDEIMEATGY